MKNEGVFRPSDLPIMHGKVYHLDLKPEELAGFVKETAQRVSIVTSGMGTPSLEIILNELVALNEIDFHKRTRKTEYKKRL